MGRFIALLAGMIAGNLFFTGLVLAANLPLEVMYRCYALSALFISIAALINAIVERRKLNKRVEVKPMVLTVRLQDGEQAAQRLATAINALSKIRHYDR